MKGIWWGVEPFSRKQSMWMIQWNHLEDNTIANIYPHIGKIYSQGPVYNLNIIVHKSILMWLLHKRFFILPEPHFLHNLQFGTVVIIKKKKKKNNFIKTNMTYQWLRKNYKRPTHITISFIIPTESNWTSHSEIWSPP